ARRANLMLLFEKALKFEQSSPSSSLFSFIKHTDTLEKREQGQKKAIMSNDSQDLVQIMTIHKSKGLEYPIVFLCNTSKQFNLRDAGEKMVLDYHLGLGLKFLDNKTNKDASILNDTLMRRSLALKKVSEQVSEEMRVLYVALTRCKEKLFIIGNNVKLKQREAHKSKSYMEWILKALGDTPDKALWDVAATNKNQSIESKAEKKQDELVNIFKKAATLKASPSNILSYPSQTKQDNARFVPGKMSVTEIKKLYYSEFLKDSSQAIQKPKESFAELAMPSDTKTEATAASKGIATHKVLENIDFNKKTADDILKILSEEEALLVPIQPLVDFLNSPLADRIRNAKKIYRELPFTVSLEAGLVDSSFEDVDGNILVHGIMDCVIEEKCGNMAIIDYKTEKVKDAAQMQSLEHQMQMSLYKIAAEKIFDKNNIEGLMYFFDKGQAIVL
ncbi:MAG: PD-(D/E)XK nuclease family protein, partial [Defluviitaleaceae bacterium]|nr:PD-(D/E)XK nuclease family protein [Defluviitaleaceae bacterium]